MKRGNALIIAIVLLLAVSIFSTGNYVPFANNFSGGAYSTVGNAIAIVTGNMLSITGAVEVVNVVGETCSRNDDCISGVCRSRKCSDQTPTSNVLTDDKAVGSSCSDAKECSTGYCPSNTKKCAKRGIGRTCASSSQCISGKCSLVSIGPNGANGICGKQRDESCSSSAQCLSKECFSGKCDYSNPTNTPGNNALDLCADDNDCKLNSNYGCRDYRCIAVLPVGSSCRANKQCITQYCYTDQSTSQGRAGYGKCQKKAEGAVCSSNSECQSNKCSSVNILLKKCAPSGTAAESLPDAGEGVSTCTSWKNCNANQYCKQIGACAADNRQITDRDCVGNYQTKRGKGESCQTSIAFSIGNDANLQYFLRSGCTANSQCQLTISGSQIYNYCRKDGFCDARLFADGRGCNTKANLCAIDEACNSATNKCIPETGPKKSNGASCTSDNECSSSFCDPATNKCAPLVAVGGEDTRNARLNRLKKAIESALNLLKARLNIIESNHQNQVTGSIAAESLHMQAAVRHSDPQTLSEWKTALTSLSASMQEVEDRICKESFNHPEIETEGLPCSLSTPAAPGLPKPKASSLPKAISPIKKVNIPFAIPRESEFQ